MAIEHGIQYDKCQTESAGKLACILDKATANVGAIFAGQVDGRVSTEVDPREAYDTGQISEIIPKHVYILMLLFTRQFM